MWVNTVARGVRGSTVPPAPSVSCPAVEGVWPGAPDPSPDSGAVAPGVHPKPAPTEAPASATAPSPLARRPGGPFPPTPATSSARSPVRSGCANKITSFSGSLPVKNKIHQIQQNLRLRIPNFYIFWQNQYITPLPVMQRKFTIKNGTFTRKVPFPSPPHHGGKPRIHPRQSCTASVSHCRGGPM